jgi:hypothetical protein
MTRGIFALFALAVLAMANRIPRLDHLNQGLVSLLGNYLLFAGLVILYLLYRQGMREGEAAPLNQQAQFAGLASRDPA